MELTQASDGTYNLHLYRDGDEYFRQKSPIFLKEFTNIRFSVMPQPPYFPVVYHDITKGIPCPDNSLDTVNAYHVFEHLSLSEGEYVAQEFNRVLKPGGICRISVPDLELIAREYIEYLEKSLKDPNEQNLQRYKWAVMEMIDQATREYSGGLMLDTLNSGDFDNDFVKARYGDVFDMFFDKRSAQETKPASSPVKKSWLQKALSISPPKIQRKWVFTKYEYQLKQKKKEIAGDPRKTKEAVRWMHDRLSLRLLVEKADFIDCKHQDFDRSDIPNWDQYDLDRSNYGNYAIDPSVYIECRKKQRKRND